MKRCVVDASLLVKLFVVEENSREAVAAVEAVDSLFAPDLVWAETANVLWKYVRRGDLPASDAEAILGDIVLMQIETVASHELVEAALAIAVETDRSVYDCLYLALAVERKCHLLTADERLANALSSARYSRHVRYVGRKR